MCWRPNGSLSASFVSNRPTRSPLRSRGDSRTRPMCYRPGEGRAHAQHLVHTLRVTPPTIITRPRHSDSRKTDMASTFDPVRMSRLRDDQSGADATNTHLYITAAVLGLLFYAVFKVRMRHSLLCLTLSLPRNRPQQIMQMPDQAETSLAALRKERAEGKSSATRVRWLCLHPLPLLPSDRPLGFAATRGGASQAADDAYPSDQRPQSLEDADALGRDGSHANHRKPRPRARQRAPHGALEQAERQVSSGTVSEGGPRAVRSRALSFASALCTI
jgi:hypothetical protein